MTVGSRCRRGVGRRLPPLGGRLESRLVGPERSPRPGLGHSAPPSSTSGRRDSVGRHLPLIVTRNGSKPAGRRYHSASCRRPSQPSPRGSRLASAAMVAVSNIRCDADVGQRQGDTLAPEKKRLEPAPFTENKSLCAQIWRTIGNKLTTHCFTRFRNTFRFVRCQLNTQ